MNKTNRAAVILALLAGICIGGAAAAVSHAMPRKASPTVQALYQQAIEDAVVAGEEEIYPLVEITGDSDLVTWNEKKIYHEPLMKTENVEFVWDSEIIALLHNEKLTGIQIRNVKTGEESTLACDGVFVSVGMPLFTERRTAHLSTPSSRAIWR